MCHHVKGVTRIALITIIAVMMGGQSLLAQTPGQIAWLLNFAQQKQVEWQQQRAQAEEHAQKLGIPIKGINPDSTEFELQRFVDGMPLYYITHNLNAAKTVSTDDVWPGGGAGLSLNGSGQTLGEWDGGGVHTTHQEYSGRVTQKDSPASTSWHATHVAGTIVASGAVASAKGMSFAASLDAYDWNSDESEMATAAAAGLKVSNHSYGFITGWYWNGSDWYWYGVVGESEDRGFGFYDSNSKDWDDIAYNAPNYLIIKSAGNDRNDSGPGAGGGHYHWTGSWTWATDTHPADGWDNGGYDTIGGGAGSAKNLMTIGAVGDIVGGWSAPGDVVMSTFSGWGPTDDGRIKPDVVGNGVSLYSSYWNSSFPTQNNWYATASGTSMSSPNVTGTIGLILHHQQNLNPGVYLRSATVKALLIHTADEAGSNTGPDYEFGWGLINTHSAVDLMTNDDGFATSFQIKEDDLAQSQTREYQTGVSGGSPFRATLCWTDPSGTSPAGGVDPTTLMLVNDLDLRVIGPGGTSYPWVLDPSNPSNAATTGDNTRDNVEQVYIASPVSGIYTVRVTHKGTLTSSPQDFSLIMTGNDDVIPVELASLQAQAGPGEVTLNWSTATETENMGFHVYRSMKADGDYTQINSHLIPGAGSSDEAHTYSHTDRDVEAGKTYHYKLADVDSDGNLAFHGPVAVTLSSVPANYALHDAHPNPFSTEAGLSADIRFDIAEAGQVSLSIYNLQGQLVRTLVAGERPAGSHSVSWDGTTDKGLRVASGVYIYTLKVNGFDDRKKMTVIE